MEDYRIQVIGHTQVPNWVSFLNANRIEEIGRTPRTLNVDFTNMAFIAPYHVVSLACLIEEFHLKGVKIRFTKGDNVGTRYLDNLGFFQYWSEGFDRTEYRPDEIRTSFCLWKLHPEMFHPYVIHATEYFNRHFFNGLDLQPLNTSLTELFNNVVDHSKSKVSGYVFTQYYPGKKQIVISLCDFGNGIPKTINKFLERNRKKPMTNIDALMLGFKKGFSTESTPSNRGLGLDNISTILKTMKSELLIISNDVYIRQQNDGTFVKHSMSEAFPGTQVVIHLNTDYLKPLEIEDVVSDEFNF